MQKRDPLHSFLPHTSTAVMRDFWSRSLPELFGISEEIADCQIAYSRCRSFFKPASWHKSFINICYRLEVAGHEQPVILYGRGHLDGGSRKSFEQAQASDSNPASSSGMRWVPEMDMVIWRFPEDPGLPQLPQLLNPELAPQFLPLQQLGNIKPEQVNHVDIQVVRYRPEQRCILRYEITHGKKNARNVLYAKVFNDGKGAQVFSRISHCHGLGVALGARVARPVHYDPSMRTVWQEALTGTPPAEYLANGNYREIMQMTGSCLARLHAARLPMNKTVSRKDRLADAIKKSCKLAQAFPELSESLERLAGYLQARLPQLPPAQETVIHGDMHFGQFLIQPDGTLALFDFDEWSLGDPAQDLADLIVDPHVRHHEHDRANVPKILLQDMIKVLLESYRLQGGKAADAAVDWHARVQFINKAYRAAIQQEPAWRNKVPELVEFAMRGIVFEPSAESRSMPEEA